MKVTLTSRLTQSVSFAVFSLEEFKALFEVDQMIARVEDDARREVETLMERAKVGDIARPYGRVAS